MITTQKAQNIISLVTSIIALLALAAGASAWFNNTSRNDVDFERRLQCVEKDSETLKGDMREIKTDVKWIRRIMEKTK